METQRVASINQKIDAAAHAGTMLTRNEIRETLKIDLRRVHVTVTTILQTTELLDAYADVLYKRYIDLKTAELDIPDPASIPNDISDNDDPAGLFNKPKTSL